MLEHIGQMGYVKREKGESLLFIIFKKKKKKLLHYILDLLYIYIYIYIYIHAHGTHNTIRK